MSFLNTEMVQVVEILLCRKTMTYLIYVVNMISADDLDTQHYSDVIMSAMASPITGVSIVYWIVCSGTDQGKHQSSVSLAFVRGIHWSLVNSLHKGPGAWKMFPFDDVIMGAQISNHTIDLVQSEHSDHRSRRINSLDFGKCGCTVHMYDYLTHFMVISCSSCDIVLSRMPQEPIGVVISQPMFRKLVWFSTKSPAATVVMHDWFCHQGPLLLTRTYSKSIPAWGSNYIHFEIWDKITYPFPNFIGNG